MKRYDMILQRLGDRVRSGKYGTDNLMFGHDNYDVNEHRKHIRKTWNLLTNFLRI